MHVINVRNVNHALPEGLGYLMREGIRQESRNGPVLVAPGPVTTVYQYPTERVLFSHVRDANPFFHLMEALWMLAGRDDVGFVAQFVARMREFSDNGSSFWGAYGYRWRRWFGVDQIDTAIDELRQNPTSRRVVIGMWDPRQDPDKAAAGGKDVPCNTHIYLSAANGVLDMTLCCRSNDAVWGAYGANAVHFSVLQEYIALMVGIPMGKLYQISNNFHIYPERPDVARLLAFYGEEPVSCSDPYENGQVSHLPIVNTPKHIWDRDLTTFFQEPSASYYVDGWFRLVAHPMFMAHRAHKDGDTEKAIDYAMDIGDTAWRAACVEWLLRRLAKKTEVVK